MKIGVDIDDTTAEFTRRFTRFLKTKGVGVDNIETSANPYVLLRSNGFTESDIKALIYECETNHIMELDLVEGAREALLELSKKHEIYFITARFPTSRENTSLFLKKNFPEFSHKLFMSGDMHGGAKLKNEICKEEGIDLLIEDSAKSIKYAENNIHVLLLTKPWNEKIKHENITRANSWGEIVNVIGAMEAK